MAKKTDKKKTVVKDKNRRAKMMFLVLFMLITVVCIEITTISLMAKYESSKLMALDKVPLSKLKYNDGGRIYEKVNVTAEYNFIKDKCEAGCNLEIEFYDKVYKYIIERNTDGEYFLSIIEGSSYLSYRESIGTSLRQSYFLNYNEYLTLVTVVKSDVGEYDHMIIVNEDNKLDRFTSLRSNEMELTNDGVIYYYDVCLDNGSNAQNAQLIEARRAPFSDDVEILSEPYTYFEWCKNEV